MKAYRKDFYREIHHSLGRFLSIFFIVLIGVAFFSGIRSAEPDMRLSGDTYFDEHALMDLKVLSTLGLMEEDIEAIQEVDGVASVEGAYSVDVLCKVEDSKQVLRLQSILPTLNKVQLEEGRLPKKASECVVDIDFLEQTGYEIGDTISFLSGNESDLSESISRDSYTIVGSVSSPLYISFHRGSSTIGTGSVSGFAYLMEEVFELEVYTEAYVTVEGAKELTEFTDAYDERIEEVKSAVEAIKEEREDARFDVLVQEVTEQVEESFAQYPAGMIPQEVIQETIDEQVEDLPTATWYVYDRDTLTEHSGYGENADRMKAIGKVFPVLFFLVAALISLTTMTRMVEEQRTQIGVYKALGYSRWKILQKYLWYAALATIFGSILGVLIGEKLLPYIIVTAYGIMYPHMGVVLVPYQPVYGLMAAGAALACTLLATFFACMKELHQQAAELMRPPAPKNGKRVFLEKVPFIWNRLNFTWKATVRNLIRYKKRFFMTLFGIGSCMALLLVGYGLKDSIFDIGVLQYKEIQLYDGLVILDEDASADEKEESYRLLSEQADVVDTMETYLQQVEIRKGDVHKDVNLNVAKEDADFERFVRFADRVSKESYHLDHKGAILTEKMATMLDVQVGDVVYLPHDKYGEVAVEIQAICENYLGHYLYMTKEYYEELYGEEPEYNSIYYTMKDGKEGKVRDVGEEIIETAGALSVSYTEDVQEQLDEMLGSLNIVMVVLVVSAGMLAFVVLYSLNNINITERARELATLKVLGFYDREVSSYVFRENILLTVLGAIVGIFLGQFLHRFIIVTVEVESAMFGRNIDPSSFVYSFLITMAFSLFVNLVMHAKLKRINMVESLKSVE